MERDQLNFAVVLFVLMFIVSGGNKLFNNKNSLSESVRLSKRVNMSIDSSKKLVILAGLWELAMAGLIIYSIYYDKKYLEIGVYGLMFFTLLATLIFYTRPLKYKPFLSNLSVLTGLYLMLRICEFK
mgnify:CR=1 FL=1|tara:strand:+ start:2904 stop:3284 length:381 start_codon:yes stop_codon:yes gene_type:complete